MAHAHELSPNRKAFRLWTGAIGRWWPLASHSVAQADALACTIEARTGGRIFEITRAQEEHVSGKSPSQRPFRSRRAAPESS